MRLFHNGIYQRKKLKNQIKKKQADMVLPVSPKVGLDNNCPKFNVNDVVPRVWKINRYTNFTHKSGKNTSKMTIWLQVL